jgi:iron complex outermembrane receptor protein
MRVRSSVCSLVFAGLVLTVSAAMVRADEQPKEPETVVVQGVADLQEESRLATLGPFGTRDVQEIPYSLSVIPAELFSSQQRKTIADALRYLPSVQADAGRLALRGVQGSVIENTRLDGFNVVGTTDYPLEEFDRIEVLDSMAGSLYGPADASGTFNFVQKRAPRDPSLMLHAGVSEHGAVLGNADFGGPLLSDGSLRGRANLLLDDGDTFVGDSSLLRRALAAVSLDKDFAAGTSVYLNFSDYHFDQRGLPGVFGVATNIPFPSPVDPKRPGYGQPYAGNYNDTTTGSIRVEQRLGSDWVLSGGFLRQIADRQFSVVTNTLTNTAGAYTTTGVSSGADRFTVNSNQARLDGKFVTGPVKHDLVIGTTGYDWANYNPRAGVGSLVLGSASLTNPVVYPEPAYPDYTNRYQSALQTAQSIIVADNIGLGESWDFMASAAYSWLHAYTYNLAGATTRASSDADVSPGASLTWHPFKGSSIYGSYADTLQPGDIAPAGTENANDVLPAYRTKEYEVGYKQRLSGMDLSAAVFEIRRPYAYADPTDLVNGLAVFRTVGLQQNRGVELNAVGSVTPLLSLYAGVSYLDPKILDSASSASDGKRIVGLSHFTTSISADVRIPAVAGLSANARIVGADRRPANDTNTQYISGYWVGDIGLALEREIWGRQSIFRLSVYNVTGEKYWTNVVPGGLGGYSGVGNASANVGAPRTGMASWTMNF